MTQHDAHTVRAFWDNDAAQAAVTELQAQGFLPEQIGYAARQDHRPTDTEERDEHAEQAAEGAVKGVAIGGVLGGLGIAAVSLIPGIGPIIGGGILASMLGGAVLGAGAGGILGSLTGLGVSHEEATFYDEQIKAGHHVVAVRSGDRSADATAIMERYGGYAMTAPPAAAGDASEGGPRA